MELNDGLKKSFAALDTNIKSSFAIAIPLGLTILRLLLGPLAILLAMTNQPRFIFAPLLVIGMLSDIFDGVSLAPLASPAPGSADSIA